MSRFEIKSFCEPPDPELLCGICMNVLDDPKETPCRHVFCKVCIAKALEAKSKCPMCRSRCKVRSLRSVLPLVQNLLNKLRMKCQNYREGKKEASCNEILKKEFYLSHLKRCGYAYVDCPYDGCKALVLRKDRSVHKLICQHRLVLCSRGCGISIKWKDLPTHSCVEALKNLVKDLEAEKKDLEKRVRSLEDTLTSKARSSTTFVNTRPSHQPDTQPEGSRSAAAIQHRARRFPFARPTARGREVNCRAMAGVSRANMPGTSSSSSTQPAANLVGWRRPAPAVAPEPDTDASPTAPSNDNASQERWATLGSRSDSRPSEVLDYDSGGYGILMDDLNHFYNHLSPDEDVDLDELMNLYPALRGDSERTDGENSHVEVNENTSEEEEVYAADHEEENTSSNFGDENTDNGGPEQDNSVVVIDEVNDNEFRNDRDEQGEAGDGAENQPQSGEACPPSSAAKRPTQSATEVGLRKRCRMDEVGESSSFREGAGAVGNEHSGPASESMARQEVGPPPPPLAIAESESESSSSTRRSARLQGIDAAPAFIIPEVHVPPTAAELLELYASQSESSDDPSWDDHSWSSDD